MSREVIQYVVGGSQYPLTTCNKFVSGCQWVPTSVAETELELEPEPPEPHHFYPARTETVSLF